MKQKLLAIALAAVLLPGLLWVLGLVGVTMAFRADLASRRTRFLSEAALTAPLIASSKALLRDEPLLAAAPADGADAAPVLNPLLHWSDSSKAELRVQPPKTAAQFKKWDKDWASHADELDADEGERDLGYMADLARYDFWTFPSRAPPPEGTWVSPLVGEFGFDAKLRMLRGLRDGKPEQAAAEVRALARLLIRSENHNALTQGMWLTRLERSAYDVYVSSGKTPLPEWQPWTGDRSNALRVLFLTDMAACAPLAPDSLVADQFADLPVPLRCMAEAQGIWNLAGLRDSGDSQLAPALARARGWLARPDGCRLVNAREAWNHDPLFQIVGRSDAPGPIVFLTDFVPLPLLRPLRGTVFLWEESMGAGGQYRSAREPPK